MNHSLVPFTDTSFQVGLSFAGEQRPYVEQVALSLKARGVTVYYDAFHEVEMWGCNLVDTLHDLYSERMSYVLMFISKDYVRKDWTNLERSAALQTALKTRGKYILPVRFDDSVLPGFPSTIKHLNAHEHTPEQIAVRVCQLLGMGQNLKADQTAAPQSQSASATIEFCHKDHNGRYVIGRDEWLFEIKVSSASGSAIHLYNDPGSIRGVAIAEGATAIADVSTASSLNYTSRVRTPREGQIAVLENQNGFFAALKLLDVEDRAQGDDHDRVVIEYRILREGGGDFSVGAKP